MAAPARTPMLLGEARFDSAPFSNRWDLVARDTVIARLFRDPSRHVSTVTLGEGLEMELAPESWGTVIASAEGEEYGRIVRTSWWGRSWDVTARGFAATLTSDPLPRRWSIRIGNEAVGGLAGGLFSYNHLRVHTDIGVPLTVIVLGWHVLARPWEQAAAPGTLVRR
ncbi:MAG: hypothetical protein R3290_03615 [Acidimicrobiia bacterium]|nr:hypothetical protein [Acidimicrobiia bacterium]